MQERLAIISIGGTVISKSLKIAGDKFNNDIIDFVRDEFKLLIGEPTAEELKISIGSAVPFNEKFEMPIRGRDISTGLPKEVIVKNHQVRAAINKSLYQIIESIKETIEKAPPELVGDILSRGIHLCGGGSLLKGIDDLIEKNINVKTFIVDDPLTCVARGTGVAIENLETYKNFFNAPIKPFDISL